ncbi:MAG: NUDIX domain-containing protein [Patescibacteria group bacterium]|nr:NUDIX domain-containing protein [Patescibacteria group bacterium]
MKGEKRSKYNKVECKSLFGKKCFIAKNKIRNRVSVYAVIIDKNKILLTNSKNTKKLFLPGGEIESHETIEQALKREVKEETGTKIKIKAFLNFKEVFFYYDPRNEAYHNFSFFYLCEPLTKKLTEKHQVEFDESEKPEWKNLSELKKKDLQPPTYEVIKKYLGTE